MNSSIRSKSPWVLCLCLGACVTPTNPSPQPGNAGVDARGTQTPATDFSFAIEPYVWAAGIVGDVSAGAGPGVAVDADFSDLLENLEGGLMFAGEAWFGREWGMLGDVTWMDLAGEGSGPLGNATIRGETELVHGQLSAMWRASASKDVMFDCLAGVRLIDIESGLQVGSQAASAGETLLDPVVGLRATIPLGSQFQFVALADVGGFGVGTDLSYQVLATIGWQVSSSIGVGLGWRQLGLDFDESELAMDAAFSGPLLGMRIAF